MLNTSLKNDLKRILDNKANVKVAKGDVSGNSIEVSVKGTPAFYESYLYYDKVEDMDSDIKELENLIAA